MSQQKELPSGYAPQLAASDIRFPSFSLPIRDINYQMTVLWLLAEEARSLRGEAEIDLAPEGVVIEGKAVEVFPGEQAAPEA